MLTPDDRMWTIRRVLETGKPERIEGCNVSVEQARAFCYLYDKLSEESRTRLASYPTSKAIWLAQATLEKR